jgi:hypothetical protein
VNRILISLALFFISISTGADEYSFADASIKIPAGFEGPFEQSMGPGTSAIAFRHLHGDGNDATLLQITIWNPGKPFPEMSDDELKEGAAQYLAQFLSGVARKRNNFKQGDVEFITISDVPVAKVDWSGDLGLKKAHGVMYCYIFNSKIVSLHTQDLVEFNELYLEQAVKAFETIKLAR